MNATVFELCVWSALVCCSFICLCCAKLFSLLDQIPSVIQPQEWDAFGHCGCAKLFIQGCKRKVFSAGEFQVGGVIQSQPMSPRQPRRGAPGVSIRFWINSDQQ